MSKHASESNVEVSPSKKFKGGEETSKFKLTYFNFRWLAEPIRYIFKYVEEDFEDTRIEMDEWQKPEMDKTVYPYGKIPMLEWDNKKLSQSFTIARYLGKQFKLTGADDFESAKCDEYADVMKDVLKEVESMWHEDEAKKLKIKNNVLDKTLPALFTKVENDLKAKDGKHLVGNGITWVDFILPTSPRRLNRLWIHLSCQTIQPSRFTKRMFKTSHRSRNGLQSDQSLIIKRSFNQMGGGYALYPH